MGRQPSGITPADLPRGVTIRHLVDGDRIQIAFTYQGQQCRELLEPGRITRARIDQAAGLRNEVRRRIADGVFDYGAYFPGSPNAKKLDKRPGLITVGSLLRIQRATYLKMVENKKLSGSTVLGYIKAIDHHLSPKFGHLQLLDLTGPVIRAWIKTLDGTAKTTRNILTPLRSMLDDAVSDELIESNPVDNMALGKLLRQTAKASEYEVDPFGPDEIDAVAAKARHDEAPAIRTLLSTGLRTGEFVALRWGDIDFERQVLRIQHNAVIGLIDGKHARVEKDPKTAAGMRIVDLDDLAAAALEVQKTLTGDRDLVFYNPRSDLPWTDGSFRKTMWKPLLERAGVRYRNPYQTRHTYASQRLMAGSNPWWLADQMGHVDVEMIFKTYGKWIPEQWKKSARNAPEMHADPATDGDTSVTS